MNLLTFRGERSIADISKRAFRRLTPRQLEKAEAALLRANPQLKNLDRVPKGSVLHVPDLPEFKAKRKPNPERPDEQINKDLVATLSAFGKTFDERIKLEKRNTTAQRSLLKSRKFKKAVATSPRSKDLATKTAKAVDARAKKLTARQKTMEDSIKQILKDLEQI